MIHFFLVLFLNSVFAAPHPGVGSSVLQQPDQGSLFSMFGFKNPALNKKWKLSPQQMGSESIQLDFVSSNLHAQESTTAISFKLEKISEKTHLNQLTRKYLKDYNSYGFNVKNVDPVTVPTKSNIEVLKLNTVHKANSSASIQYLIRKSDQLIVMTCIGSFENHDSTTSECKTLFDNMIWK